MHCRFYREKAFKELQILEREESRKRECSGEIIKMKESASLEWPPSNKHHVQFKMCNDS